MKVTEHHEGAHRRRSHRWSLWVSVASLGCSMAAVLYASSVHRELDRLRQQPAQVVTRPEPPRMMADASVAAPPQKAAVDDLPDPGQSVGSPRRGSLFGATRFPAGSNYVLRHPERVFGTEGTVRHVLAAIDHVQRSVPGLHRLAIGDLSTEVGGWISGHVSHQSGRDVDLGFFYRRRPPTYPNVFVRGSRDNLHFRGMWALIEGLCATAEQDDGVEWILLDYRIQRSLYNFVRGRGVDATTLARIFQYPRGPTANVGLVRHYPGHDNHFHVRFKCSQGDPACVPGMAPWVLPEPLQQLDRVAAEADQIPASTASTLGPSMTAAETLTNR